MHANNAPDTVKTKRAGPTFRPLYQQIKELLLEKLQAGEWMPGEIIPSEIELASHFHVSQGTVRKALDALTHDNLLTRHQGKGTFVATHAEQTTQYRFLRLVPDDARVSSQPALDRTILIFEHVGASQHVAQALRLPPTTATIHIRRTLESDKTPIILEDIWLPTQAFPTLTLPQLHAYAGPTYALFETVFGVRMVRADEKIKATFPTQEQAAQMRIAQKTPLLSVERTSFTYNNDPMEFRQALYCTSCYHYRNELS